MNSIARISQTEKTVRALNTVGLVQLIHSLEDRIKELEENNQKEKPMTSKFEIDLIDRIAERAVSMAKEQGSEYSKSSAMMDLESAHLDCPLKLDELLNADNFNFSHDVFGIANHIDRSTYPGKLTGCFLPRYALT